MQCNNRSAGGGGAHLLVWFTQRGWITARHGWSILCRSGLREVACVDAIILKMGMPAESAGQLEALRQSIRPGVVIRVWTALQRLDVMKSGGSVEKVWGYLFGKGRINGPTGVQHQREYV